MQNLLTENVIWAKRNVQKVNIMKKEEREKYNPVKHGNGELVF